MKLGIAHPSTLTSPTSWFAQDYLSGVSSISIKNTQGEFTTNKFACLGSIGFSQAELIQIASVTAPQTLGLSSATNFAHNGDDKITQFDFNQIHVYKSTTGINGSYVLDQTVNINVADDFTIYEDTASQTSYYYKTAYYNSVTTYEAPLSDPIAATGFVFYSLKTMIDRVLSCFGDINSQFVSRDEVKDYLNEFYEECQQGYFVSTKRQLVKVSSPITVVGNQESYALPSDFLMEKAIRVSQDNGQTYPFFMSHGGVDQMGHTYQSNVLYQYWIDGSNIYLDPIPLNSSDMFKIYYVPLPSTMSLQTDVLIVPFQNASNMFVKYALGLCYLKNKKFDEFTALTTFAQTKRDSFLSFIKKMQTRHPQTTQIVDDTYLR